MATKVGSIVLATDQGLGYLAKAFYDHGLIQKVYIQPHSSRPSHPEWYREEDMVASPEDLLDCDTLLFFEEVFHWKLIPKAREKGIKTVLMPMYECTKNPLPYVPDVVITPSLLDQQYYPESEFIPVPVEVPWRLRTRAHTFVHNAGNGGIGGRNGTKELLAAMEYVKSPIMLTINTQMYIPWNGDTRITIHQGTRPHDELWRFADVFIFPEKFNGLSLPLQEAFASGMAVMCGDRFPMNTWLPKEMLIPIDHYTKERIAVEFDCAQFDPKVIAQRIDEVYTTDITQYSEAGKVFADTHSWHNLKEKYETVLLPL
jgi:hypothetical protein